MTNADLRRGLLLFEPDFPCWDEETVSLAGENKYAIRYLCDSGYVSASGEGFILTDLGIRTRMEIAEEYGMKTEPIKSFDPESSLWNNRLYLLMEKAFRGQYSVKEYSLNEHLPVVPDLPANELYRIEKGHVIYTWQKHPLVRSFMETFPNWGVRTRGQIPPGENALEKWISKYGAASGSLRTNLLLRSRYDFELYRKEPPYEWDICRLKDTDRYFFFKVTENNLSKFYEDLGKLHIFLLGQKRVHIPGYADFDSQDQEAWTICVTVTETEHELKTVAKELSRNADALIEPSKPLFIIGTSIERLRNQKIPEDTAYDWFCDRTLHIARPDA